MPPPNKPRNKTAPSSPLDVFYARQRGAPSRADRAAFRGQTAEDIAEEMKASGERSGFGGVGKMPDRNLSPREQIMLGLGGASVPTASAITDPAAAGNTPVVGDPFGTGHQPLQPSNPFIPTLRQTIGGDAPSRRPVDPSTVRQPSPLLPPPKDAAGNPASDSNPIAGTPAEFRQMNKDAQIGRTVTTTGTPGLTPAAGGGTAQATDFRRLISSRYGTGSNVTRQPGQGVGTMTDPITGKPVPMKQALADQSAVQDTKLTPGGDEDLFNPAKLRQSMRKGRA